MNMAIPTKKTSQTQIAFADLIHSDHSCRAFPLGIGLVASNTRKIYGKQVAVDIFKFSSDFANYLAENNPQIVCFSNYCWNFNISYQFAKRIKSKEPNTIIVMGGPNFPREDQTQQIFLNQYPAIDFYMRGEGEFAFPDLLKIFLESDFDVRKIKDSGLKIQNCFYAHEGLLVSGSFMERIGDLNDIPSPYLGGLFDKFFREKLYPLIQTSRGCPFTCSFCQEATEYFNKIKHWTINRITDELEYIAKRTKAAELLLADSNFGMYPWDYDTSKAIASVQSKYGWPLYVNCVNGKNRKERVLEVASNAKGMLICNAIQTTDADVLKNIRRDNISLDTMVFLARESERMGATSCSEIILSLPGDTKEKHIKSMCDVMDAGISVARSHQLLLLPDSELASVESRKKYQLKSRYRLAPRTHEYNTVFNDTFGAPEIDDICVSTSSLTYDAYIECRCFDLTVEVFYNAAVFIELYSLCKRYGILPSELVKEVYAYVQSDKSILRDLYDGYIEESHGHFETPEAALTFLEQPGILESYQTGKLGNNEQLNYRAMCFFGRMKDLHDIIFSVAEKLLQQKNTWTPDLGDYLSELRRFGLLRKDNLLSLDHVPNGKFHYDFIGLMSGKFSADPVEYKSSTELDIRAFHTPEQRELIERYTRLHGQSISSLGTILSFSNTKDFYRNVSYVNLAKRSSLMTAV